MLSQPAIRAKSGEIVKVMPELVHDSESDALADDWIGFGDAE